MATRLTNNETVVGAWMNATIYDDPSGMSSGTCVMGMSCDSTQGLAQYRIGNETYTNAADPRAAPTWCQWNAWCK